jgi:SNF2 family DNA or RNA helicase
MEEKDEKEEKQEDEDDSECCKICWGPYTSPITYLKSCGHYFCKGCIDAWKGTQSNLKCPMCRKDIMMEDIINIQEICDINNSSKIHELLNIINGGDKYIIFTQFNKVINRIQSVLTRNNITSSTLDKYTDENVLLLSSQQNAEGINLSMFDKMIIFEPFENNVYNNQVEQQLIARIHRVGRVKPVDVYRFITIETIEEKIYSEFS